jgi:hypothetical protein
MQGKRDSRLCKLKVSQVVPYSVSYVPLIAPSTSLPRIRFLASIADSFIYVVSKVSHFCLMHYIPFMWLIDGYYWVICHWQGEH